MKRNDWESFANKVMELADEYGVEAEWSIDAYHGYYSLYTDIHEPDYKDFNEKEEYYASTYLT